MRRRLTLSRRWPGMSDPTYDNARHAARKLLPRARAWPPVDIDRVAREFADVEIAELPIRCDCTSAHGLGPGDRPRIFLHAAIADDEPRRRFALAHQLAHVVLGWHPLGAPCDVTRSSHELPTTVHDLLEGEANAFARQLMMQSDWLRSFDAFDRPAELMRHAARQAIVPLASAARVVARLLEPETVWTILDVRGIVVDAGRSPDSSIRVPEAGTSFDPAVFGRVAKRRQRVTVRDCVLHVWNFGVDAVDQLPHDRTARTIIAAIAHEHGLDEHDAAQLQAHIDGVAGYCNEQYGHASMHGMSRGLRERIAATPGLAIVAADPACDELVHAKALELVSRRLAYP